MAVLQAATEGHTELWLAQKSPLSALDPQEAVLEVENPLSAFTITTIRSSRTKHFIYAFYATDDDLWSLPLKNSKARLEKSIFLVYFNVQLFHLK